MGTARLTIDGFKIAVNYSWQPALEGSKQWCIECKKVLVLPVNISEISRVTVRGKVVTGGKYRQQALALVKESVGRRCKNCQLRHGDFGWFS